MDQKSIRMLRRPAVEVKTGLGRSALYERLNPESKYYDSSFPRPVKLGSGPNPPIAWVEAEVDAWLAQQIERSRAAA
jgi:prophage regulatory protein